MNQAPQMQVVPLTTAVKGLIIANVAVWVGGVLILQNMILGNNLIFDLFALVPAKVITSFWVWQVFTYMFIHSGSVFQILMNMLVLWWFGAELEMRWGSKFFLSYFLVCGAGAGAIYLLGTLAYYLITGHVLALASPLFGCTAATFGLLLAYGLLFGERVIAFMMLFPMKAKYFTMIIGAIELFNLLDSGSGHSGEQLGAFGRSCGGFLVSDLCGSLASPQNLKQRETWDAASNWW